VLKVKKLFVPIFLIILLISLIVGILYIYIKQSKSDKDITRNSEELKGKSDLLEDYPVYPGAILESSFTTEGDNKATSSVWKTDDSISEVYSFYTKELEEGDWEITSIVENENLTALSFTRGESYGFAGIGKAERNLTVISVTIGLR
jgi:ABC-type glycerol-3-phosphate transport system permease component